MENIPPTSNEPIRFLKTSFKKDPFIKMVVFSSITIIFVLIFIFFAVKIERRITRQNMRAPEVRVTIPEGFNVLSIENTLAPKLPNFNKDKFLSEAEKKEGYLFPDTYNFFTTANQEDVLKIMNDNFEKKIIPLQPEIISSGKTENEIITMASLIEREAKGSVDRAMISGILWNRINKGLLLQVDSAPETYKIKGLPSNPIANPGLEAIKAAIHPESSPYLFYLHDKSGMIHYAITFVEHEKNVVKYLK